MGHGCAFSRHARSERGTIALIWGIALVMVFGFMAMIMDVGRVNTTHSELQTFADHVALAAAGELDGNSDAITRANAAAANLISDTQTFANGSPVLSGVANYTLTFHSELPASDTAALGANLTTDPRKAAFARVEVTPRTQPMFFTGALRSILGTSSTPVNAQIAAEAVAGFTQEACDITPLMFCLPSSSYTAEANIGKQVLLRTGGSGAGWGPGDFGFLDPSSSNLGPECAGENGLKNIVTCLIGASQNITTCFSQRGVDVEPGQAVGIWNDAFNMRFDEFSGDTNKYKTKEKFAPAANIIKGKKDGCSPDNSVNTMALPRDTCLVVGNCTDGRFGSGVWEYGKYIDKNYGNNNGILDDDEDEKIKDYSVAAKNGSRYETYLREIEYLKSLAPATGPILEGRDSTGVPQCYTGSGPKTAGKRLVIAAGIDCTANPINGAAKGVPVAEFFELFLTERVGAGTGSPKKFDLLVEIVGSAGKAGYTSAGSGGIFRDVVQLYR